MGAAIYLLGALVTLACAVLLLRAYVRVKRKLLLWSGICFAGLTISNILILVDLVIFPGVDLYVFRLSTAAFAMAILLYGLIWDSR